MHFGPVVTLGATPGAACAVMYDMDDIVGHIGPAESSLDGFEQIALARVSYN